MPVTALLLLLLAPAISDTAAVDSLMHSGIREILDQLQEEAGGRDLMEALLWREDHPFDLNRVSIGELLSLPFVTETEAEGVIRFRTSEGGFRSLDQLRTMQGGGIHALQAIGPYVRITPRRAPAGAQRIVSFRSRLEERRPADAGAIGGPVHAYSRLTLAPIPGIETGGLFERDAGERSRDALTSGYLAARGILPAADVLIGDFSVEAGQGLVLWRGTGMSKSGWSVTGPRKAPLGVLPHRSTDEIRFFRGIALSAHLADDPDRWDAILFISRRFLPGGTGDAGEIVTISESSAFTTTSASARKDAVRADAKGGRILYSRGEWLSAGLTFVSSRFALPVRREDPFRFSGGKFDATGADIWISRFPFLLFGESARGGGGNALVAGAGIEPGRLFSALLVFRSYSPGYDNLYANGFGDNGDTRNEQGAYAGLALQPLSWLSIRAYYDQFRRPGPGTFAQFPVAGDELMVDAGASFASRMNVTARFTAKSVGVPIITHEENGRESRAEGERTQLRWRFGSSVRFDGGTEFRTRFELTNVSIRPGADERGILIAGELHARPAGVLQLAARLVFFATDSYESRLYTFEADLPGTFSSHPLYGRGRRWSVHMRLDLSGWCTLSATIDSMDKEPSVSNDPPNREILPARQSHAGLQLDLRL